MRLSSVTRLALCFLLFAALAVPEVASACSGRCVVVAPPFCRRCMDAGVETGVACRDSGNCGCFYVQCPPSSVSLQRDEGQVTLVDLGIAEPATASTACGDSPSLSFAALVN